MRRTTLALVLLLAGVATPLAAQTPPPPPPHGDDAPPPPPRGGPGGGMLLRADANGDGIVTRTEAAAAADARFDRLDADRDGTVTPEEMRGGRGPAGGPPPGAGAPTPPRAMTRDESRARALEAFDRADANYDGRVDKGELARLGDERPGPRGGGDGPPPPPPQD